LRCFLVFGRPGRSVELLRVPRQGTLLPQKSLQSRLHWFYSATRGPMKHTILSILQQRMDKCTNEQWWAVAALTAADAFIVTRHECWMEFVPGGFRCYHGRDDLGHLYYYSAPFCLSQESRCDGFVGGGRARCPRVFKESPECVEFSLGFVRRPVLRRMGSSRLDSVFRRYFSRPMIRPHRHARASEAVAAQKQ